MKRAEAITAVDLLQKEKRDYWERFGNLGQKGGRKGVSKGA